MGALSEPTFAGAAVSRSLLSEEAIVALCVPIQTFRSVRSRQGIASLYPADWKADE